MAAPVTWFEINSRNSVSLRTFYGDVFGWKFQPVEGEIPYAVVDTGADGGIAGGIGEADDANRVLVYIEVADADAFLGKVEQAGGRVLVPVTVIPDLVTFALFADPEGNVIGLTQPQQ